MTGYPGDSSPRHHQHQLHRCRRPDHRHHPDSHDLQRPGGHEHGPGRARHLHRLNPYATSVHFSATVLNSWGGTTTGASPLTIEEIPWHVDVRGQLRLGHLLPVPAVPDQHHRHRRRRQRRARQQLHRHHQHQLHRFRRPITNTTTPTTYSVQKARRRARSCWPPSPTTTSTSPAASDFSATVNSWGGKVHPRVPADEENLGSSTSRSCARSPTPIRQLPDQRHRHRRRRQRRARQQLHRHHQHHAASPFPTPRSPTPRLPRPTASRRARARARSCSPRFTDDNPYAPAFPISATVKRLGGPPPGTSPLTIDIPRHVDFEVLGSVTSTRCTGRLPDQHHRHRRRRQRRARQQLHRHHQHQLHRSDAPITHTRRPTTLYTPRRCRAHQHRPGRARHLHRRQPLRHGVRLLGHRQQLGRHDHRRVPAHVEKEEIPGTSTFEVLGSVTYTETAAQPDLRHRHRRRRQRRARQQLHRHHQHQASPSPTPRSPTPRPHDLQRPGGHEHGPGRARHLHRRQPLRHSV